MNLPEFVDHLYELCGPCPEHVRVEGVECVRFSPQKGLLSIELANMAALEEIRDQLETAHSDAERVEREASDIESSVYKALDSVAELINELE